MNELPDVVAAVARVVQPVAPAVVLWSRAHHGVLPARVVKVRPLPLHRRVDVVPGAAGLAGGPALPRVVARERVAADRHLEERAHD